MLNTLTDRIADFVFEDVDFEKIQMTKNLELVFSVAMHCLPCVLISASLSLVKHLRLSRKSNFLATHTTSGVRS